MPNILRVTWLRDAPFRENFYHARSSFQRRSYVPNLKSLAQAVLKICLIVRQKFRGHVTSHAPLGKVIMHPVGFQHAKLLTKFEVSSPNNFQDIWNRLPQILGVTGPRPRPFWENYLSARSSFPRRSCIPNLKSLAQIVLKICSIVCQKCYGSRDLGQAPFGGNYSRAHSAFPRWSCILNLNSLVQVVLKICSMACQKF